MIEAVAILVIVSVGILVTELGSFAGGTATLVALLAAAQMWFHIPVLATITAAPIAAVIALVVYVYLGVSYAVFIRFPRFLAERQDEIGAAWREHTRANAGDEVTEDMFRASYRFLPYTASANASKIASWAMLWPWGAAWDVTNRPVRWTYQSVSHMFSGMLARVERRAIRRSTLKGP